MTLEVEPQEIEELLVFYRLRWHQQMASQGAASRLIEARDREIKDLSGKLKGAEGREAKLQTEIAALKKDLKDTAGHLAEYRDRYDRPYLDEKV